MLKQLWSDDEGAALTAELCVVGAVLVIGLVVGIASVQSAMFTEIEDVGEAVESFDFTPDVKSAGQTQSQGVQPQGQPDDPLTAADLINGNT